MVRVLLLLGIVSCVVSCGAPLRQVAPALDPSSPDAPESPPPPPRVVTVELIPPEPPTSAPPPSQTPVTEEKPAGHHMHHMHHMPDSAPKTLPPDAGKTKPMDHSKHGGAGGAR